LKEAETTYKISVKKNLQYFSLLRFQSIYSNITISPPYHVTKHKWPLPLNHMNIM